jgi:hypothetical protein
MVRVLTESDVVNRVAMLHYLGRAEGYKRALADLAQLDEDLDQYRDAIALLAVHAAIALADAILSGFTKGGRNRSDDHMDAVREIEKLCSARQIESRGAKHLSWLIKKKTDFTYGTERLDPQRDVDAAKTKVDQLFAWAYPVFQPLGGSDT